VLFFKLDPGRPDKDFAERLKEAGVTQHPPVTEERMTRLAKDMLNVEERVKKETESAEAETRRLSIKVPLVLAIVVGAGTIFAPLVSNLVSQNADLQRRISVLEDRKNDQDQIQNRLAQLEQQVSKTATPAPTAGAPGGTR
jgi:hypothetical protein